MFRTLVRFERTASVAVLSRPPRAMILERLLGKRHAISFLLLLHVVTPVKT